jgi:hypothetical protein
MGLLISSQWTLENNFFLNNGFVVFVDIDPRANQSQIVLRHNKFVASIQGVIASIPFSTNISIDARQNWFGSIKGPRFCDSYEEGDGGWVLWGVDFSNYCLDPTCTQFSDEEAPTSYWKERLCTHGSSLAQQ